MKKISVIGSGMLGINQITTEGFSIIQNTNKVFWIGEISGLKDYLSHNNNDHEELSHLYEDGGIDVVNYNRIVQYVTNSLTEYEHICLVVPGHPRIGVTIVQILQKLSDEGDFLFNCYPGISSFDAMINDIGIDPLEEGVSLLDANRLIIYDYKMDSCINYFIYHVCSIGNSNTDFSSPQLSNKASYLKSKLIKHFEGKHRIYLLSASTKNGELPDKLEENILDLEKFLSHVIYRHTLYVPSILPNKDRVNFNFLRETNILYRK